MSQQGDRQASVRAVTGTAGTYEDDWHALFTAASVAAGTFNERLLVWINLKLSAAYAEINGAMQALADSLGAANFSSIGTFDATTGATGGQLDFSSAGATGGTDLGLVTHVI